MSNSFTAKLSSISFLCICMKLFLSKWWSNVNMIRFLSFTCSRWFWKLIIIYIMAIVWYNYNHWYLCAAYQNRLIRKLCIEENIQIIAETPPSGNVVELRISGNHKEPVFKAKTILDDKVHSIYLLKLL